MQVEDLALQGGQARHAVAQCIDLVLERVAGRAVDAFELLFQQLEILALDVGDLGPALLAPVIPDEAARDATDPRSEGKGPVVAVQVGPRDEEGLLHEVFCNRCVAHCSEQERTNGPNVLANEHFK